MVGFTSITVVVVDDHEQVIKALAFSLEAREEIELVGTALNTADGCQLCKQFTPQVLITNKVMQNGDSNLIQEIKAVSSATQVFVLGELNELELVLEALDAGARGYILKQTSSLEKIVNAIEAVAAGTWVFCREIYELLPDKTAYQPLFISNADSPYKC